MRGDVEVQIHRLFVQGPVGLGMMCRDCEVEESDFFPRARDLVFNIPMPLVGCLQEGLIVQAVNCEQTIDISFQETDFVADFLAEGFSCESKPSTLGID